MYFLKLGLSALTLFLISACGGGGGSDSASSLREAPLPRPALFDVDEPAAPYYGGFLDADTVGCIRLPSPLWQPIVGRMTRSHFVGRYALYANVGDCEREAPLYVFVGDGDQEVNPIYPGLTFTFSITGVNTDDGINIYVKETY